MHWVIQENLFHEEGFFGLIKALKRLELPYSVHKVVPFTSQLIPEVVIPEGAPVIVMGATTMVRIAGERGWTPGAYFNSNFDFEIQAGTPWKPYMLNGHGKVYPFKDVPEQSELFFTRPVLDIKTYTGQVMSWAEFSDWRHRVVELGEGNGSTLHAGTRVVIAKPKVIHCEYRMYLVDGKCVAGSLYKQAGRPYQDSHVDEEIDQFAEARAKEWSPDRAFVMDIAQTPDGLRIIEAGCLNAAGYYKADLARVIMALEEMENAMGNHASAILKAVAKREPRVSFSGGGTRPTALDIGRTLFPIQEMPRGAAVIYDKTYRIVENDEGTPGIRCLKCQRTSFNPNDIEQRYCGKCHEFHDG